MTPTTNIHDTKILEELGGIRKALEAIVALKLSDELYSKEIRSGLYRQADALYGQDRAAYERVQKAMNKDGLSWEQRVEQFGEDAATEQIKPFMKAMEAKKNASIACEDFENSHPLLRYILLIRDMLLTKTI